MCVWDSYGDQYSKVSGDPKNKENGNKLLTQSLASLINEKRDLRVKLRSERWGIQRDIWEDKTLLSSFDY
jgi:hypothetical protein